MFFSDRFRGGATGSGTGDVAERAGFLKSMHYMGFIILLYLGQLVAERNLVLRLEILLLILSISAASV